jgi:hypothetical protein
MFAKIRSLFVLVVSLLISSCSLDSPVLPSWFVDVVIPIPKIETTMVDAINDSTLMADTTANGVPIVSISVTDTVPSEQVSKSDLAIEIDEYRFGGNLQLIDLSSVANGGNSTIPVSTLLGIDLNLLIGQTIDIPGEVHSPEAQPLVFDAFRYIDVNAGAIQFELTNTSFLTFSAGLSIALYDDSTGEKLGDAQFLESIPPGNQASSLPIDLSGKVISNQLSAVMTIPVAAQSNVLITSENAASSISYATVFPLLLANSLRGQLPDQEFSFDGAQPLPENGHQVVSAEMSDTMLRLLVENRMQQNATVQVILKNFQRADGSPFIKEINLDAQSTSQEVLRLDGVSMAGYPDPGAPVDELAYTAEVTTSPIADIVDVAAQDSIVITVLSDSVFFASFSGTLDTIDMEFGPTIEEDIMDYGPFEGGITFDELEMRVDISSEVGLPIDLEFTMTGYHRDPDTGLILDSLTMAPVQVAVVAGESGNPAVTSIVLDKNSPQPNVIDLMEILPTDLKMHGKALTAGEGSIAVGDQVTATYAINSPLAFSVAQITGFDSEVTHQEMDQDLRDNIRNNVEQGRLVFRVENGFPIGTRILLVVAEDSNAVFNEALWDTASTLVLDETNIQSGERDARGYVIAPTFNTITYDLTHDQLRIFDNPEVYMGTRVKLNQTPGLIRFNQQDYIKVTGEMEFKLLVNGD